MSVHHVYAAPMEAAAGISSSGDGGIDTMEVLGIKPVSSTARALYHRAISLALDCKLLSTDLHSAEHTQCRVVRKLGDFYCAQRGVNIPKLCYILGSGS